MKLDRAPKGRVSGTIFRISQGDERIEHGCWLQPATTIVNTSVVSAQCVRWLYNLRPMADEKDLDYNAAWLREMRQSIGWSTTETANRAREEAREHGDAIKLSQQLVSKFENGRLKSTPRWLAYVQVAMAVHLTENNLPKGRLRDLRLSKELAEYFSERAAWREEFLTPPTRNDSAIDEGLTVEDREDLGLLQRLAAPHREAVRNLMRSLGNEMPSPQPKAIRNRSTHAVEIAPQSLHSPARKFADRR